MLKNKTRRGPSWPVRWPVVARAPLARWQLLAWPACLPNVYRSSPYKRGLPEGSQHRATEGTDPVPIVLLADQQQREDPMRWPVVPPTGHRRATAGPPTGHRKSNKKNNFHFSNHSKNNFHFWKLIWIPEFQS